MDAEPPSAPRNVAATLNIGTAVVSWDSPKRDGGLPIKYYTVTSRLFGEDAVNRHSGLKESVKLKDGPSHKLGNYATVKTVSCVKPPLRIRGLAEGRVYGFNVIAHTESFSSPASGWSNHVRHAVREPADVRVNLEFATEQIEGAGQGQLPYQGSYFINHDTPEGWTYEVIQGLRDNDWSRVFQGLAMETARVNLQIEYDRTPPRDRRVFKYGGLEMNMFDHHIMDLDRVATTGDTLLMLAFKFQDKDVINTILNYWPDISVRNEKSLNVGDVAAQRSLLHLLEPVAGYGNAANSVNCPPPDPLDVPVHDLVIAKLA